MINNSATLTFSEIKDDIGRALEHIFLSRRIAMDLDFSAEQIDTFIKEYSKELLTKYERMTNDEILLCMVKELAGKLPNDLFE